MASNQLRERLDRIRGQLVPEVENLLLIDVTASTHAMARVFIDELDGEGRRLAPTVIISDRQERGQGRHERSWISPEGGLYLSWVQSGLDTETIARLPMLAAAAARRALAAAGIEGARIKWPNDLLVGGRKIAGILVFARHGEPTWATVGLGVNVAETPHLDDPGPVPATSVAEELRAADPGDWRDRIACSFVNALTELLAHPGEGLEAWRTLLLQQPGETVTVRLGSGETVAGTVVEVLEEGHLRLQTGDGERIVSGGDIIET